VATPSASKIACQLKSSGPNDCQLIVQFVREGDRYSHSVLLETGGQCHELLRSLEGDPQEDWPASPPLQQLSDEHQDEGHVALAVGMAGKSHWSLSAQAQPNGVVAFDVACRVTHEPQQLGSAYSVTSQQVDGLRLEVVGEGVVSNEGAASISPTLVTELPHTYRWQYSLRINDL